MYFYIFIDVKKFQNHVTVFERTFQKYFILPMQLRCKPVLLHRDRIPFYGYPNSVAN